MQLLPLPKLSFVYKSITDLSSELGSGFVCGCSWGTTYPFPDTLNCATIKLFICVLNAFFQCPNRGNTNSYSRQNNCAHSFLYRSKGGEGMCPGSCSDSQLSMLKPKHTVLVFLSNMHLCSAHFFFRITVAFLV